MQDPLSISPIRHHLADTRFRKLFEEGDPRRVLARGKHGSWNGGPWGRDCGYSGTRCCPQAGMTGNLSQVVRTHKAGKSFSRPVLHHRTLGLLSRLVPNRGHSAVILDAFDPDRPARSACQRRVCAVGGVWAVLLSLRPWGNRQRLHRGRGAHVRADGRHHWC